MPTLVLVEQLETWVGFRLFYLWAASPSSAAVVNMDFPTAFVSPITALSFSAQIHRMASHYVPASSLAPPPPVAVGRPLENARLIVAFDCI